MEAEIKEFETLEALGSFVDSQPDNWLPLERVLYHGNEEDSLGYLAIKTDYSLTELVNYDYFGIEDLLPYCGNNEFFREIDGNTW